VPFSAAVERQEPLKSCLKLRSVPDRGGSDLPLLVATGR
jgi:hypothetical protein